MSSEHAEPAVRCVRLLQKKSVPSVSLFSIPECIINGSLASALTLVLSTLSYVEDEATRNEALKNVEFDITARIEDSGSSGREEFFYMRGKPRGNNNQRRSVGEREWVNNGIMAHDQNGNEHDSSRIHATEAPHARKKPRHCTVTVLPPLGPRNDATTFTIDYKTAARVFWFLLDGTGVSTHCDADVQMDMESFSRPTVQALVQNVYNEEKKRRNAKVNLTYKDLLPQQVQSTAKARLQILRRAFIRGKDTVVRLEDVKLTEFKNYGRMKKMAAIAGLCIMLQTQGDGGSCLTVLKQFAEEGITKVGCDRVQNSLSKGQSYLRSSCTSSVCGRIAHAKTVFLDEGHKEIGTAMVYPALTVFHGQKLLPDEKVVIKVGQCRNMDHVYDDGGEFPVDALRDPSEELRMGGLYLGNFFVWDKKLLSRVQIKGELEQVIGTAVYARSMHHYVSTPGDPTAVSDPAGAVLIFDVQLDLGTQEQKAAAAREFYQFSFWYGIQAFSRLRSVHFKNRTPPQTHVQMGSTNCRALLWHERKIIQA